MKYRIAFALFLIAAYGHADDYCAVSVKGTAFIQKLREQIYQYAMLQNIEEDFQSCRKENQPSSNNCEQLRQKKGAYVKKGLQQISRYSDNVIQLNSNFSLSKDGRPLHFSLCHPQSPCPEGDQEEYYRNWLQNMRFEVSHIDFFNGYIVLVVMGHPTKPEQINLSQKLHVSLFKLDPKIQRQPILVVNLIKGGELYLNHLTDADKKITAGNRIMCH